MTSNGLLTHLAVTVALSLLLSGLVSLGAVTMAGLSQVPASRMRVVMRTFLMSAGDVISGHWQMTWFSCLLIEHAAQQQQMTAQHVRQITAISESRQLHTVYECTCAGAAPPPWQYAETQSILSTCNGPLSTVLCCNAMRADH